MSSEASRPPKSPESTPIASTRPPTETSAEAGAAIDKTNRPTLMQPPKRPKKPPEPVVQARPPEAAPKQEPKQEPKPSDVVSPEPTPASSDVPQVDAHSEAAATDTVSEAAKPPRQQPISPPSEPMQYRAIGLLQGRYYPSEENFNRGHILTQDDTQISAVLLGRVTSLVKKHLEMDSEHLWVVYPRTISEQDNVLSVQIVGVWEPETLGSETAMSEAPETSPPESETNADTASESKQTASGADADKTSPALADEIQADYFSIRGEVVKYVEDKAEIHINILQKLRSNSKQRPFRLILSGHITGKTIGYFWDLNVERQAQHLVLTKGTQIAAVPPKKKKKRKARRSPGGGYKKRSPRGSSSVS